MLTLCPSRFAMRSRTLATLSMGDAPYALADAIVAGGRRRGYVVTEPSTGNVLASDAAMQPVADFLQSGCIDYLGHEGLFLEVGRRTGALCGAFLWNTKRGAAGGGIRLRPYDSVEEYIVDGLRLATGMGRKSALTGLWHGGGKGVIAQAEGERHRDAAYRADLFADYGDFLTSLRGCYIAAEDSGVNVQDMDIVFSRSRFTTCISPSLGGSGNPSVPTAAGVAMAMEAALEFLGSTNTPERAFEGLSFAVQGCGNVARPLMHNLLSKGAARIVASDVDAGCIEQARTELAASGHDIAKVELRQVGFGDNSVLAEEVDVISPCAWGGILTPETCAAIRARVVCGAANSQLLDPDDDCGMAAAGVTYVPDFVANPMGIVNCANEMYGRVGALGTTEDPMLSDRLGREYEFSVFNSTLRVLRAASEQGTSTAVSANALADELCTQLHPIWAPDHRSQQIMDSLVNGTWADDA